MDKWTCWIFNWDVIQSKYCSSNLRAIHLNVTLKDYGLVFSLSINSKLLTLRSLAARQNISFNFTQMDNADFSVGRKSRRKAEKYMGRLCLSPSQKSALCSQGRSHVDYRYVRKFCQRLLLTNYIYNINVTDLKKYYF